MLGSLPTREKLQALRHRGIVPLSPLATRAWVVAAVFAVAIFSADRLLWLQRTAANGWQSSVAEPWIYLRSYLRPLALAVIGLSLAALVAGIAGSIAQTRGVVGTSLARESNTWRHRLRDLLVVIVVGALISLIAIANIGFSTRELLSLLRVTEVAEIEVDFGAIANRFCKLVVVVTAVLAILVMFVSRSLFLYRYREKK